MYQVLMTNFTFVKHVMFLLIKEKVLCQAVVNGFQLENVP